MSETYSKYEALATAYLTGQASPEEVAEYRRLYAVDAGFKEIVDDVETWLAPLKDAVTDQAPPDGLLAEIMDEIAQSETQLSQGDVEAVRTAKELHPAPANENSAGKWRVLAIAASIVAVLAVGSHLIPSNPSAELPTTATDALLAVLSDSSQPELMAIVYEPKTGKVVARLSNITLPENGDFELWLIREGDAAPVSLGVLSKVDEAERIEILAPLTLQTGTDTLAISLEEKGGSKSGSPEGPVLFTGAVLKI